MKHFTLALFLLAMAASAPAFAQPSAVPSEEVSLPMDAKEAFEKLKTLAGSWVGQLDLGDEVDDPFNGRFAQFSIRETSRGNALVHELSLSGMPDHPVTVFYLEGDRLIGTHYCDAGNRPRFEGKISPDGKRIDFEFLDLSGGDEHGHMHHITFTFGDENNHVEEWTYQFPQGPFLGRFELQRTHADGAAPAN